jgi:tRNA (mo5U34)-methyltransferase
VTLQVDATHDREVAALGPWFHNLHLPDGRQTAPHHPLGDFPRFKWAQLARELPQDLTGWTALDIGCNAGFYTFELARRGADVTGIDVDEHYLRQARWAQTHFDVPGRIEFLRATVWDLGRFDERFDLVLFLGVLYHLRYPLLALDLVARRVERLLVVQTLTTPSAAAGVQPPPDLPFEQRERLAEAGWPQMAFIERSLAGDPTNWWAPTEACVEAMARSAGLDVVSRPGHELYICRPRTGRSTVADLDLVREAFSERRTA